MIDNMLSQVKETNRSSLNELEGNRFLSSYGISMAKTFLATSAEEAVEIAEKIDYPIVLKVLSPEILHKTEAGCVKVGLTNKDEIIKAYNQILSNAKKYDPDSIIEGVIVQEMVPEGLELIFGINKDPQFGHTIVFGLGGIYVEVFEDIALRLVPINKEDAYAMIEETKVSKILAGARGKKYNIHEVVDILLTLSKLVQEHEEIQEIDINPFILYEDEKVGKGVDALITLS